VKEKWVGMGAVEFGEGVRRENVNKQNGKNELIHCNQKKRTQNSSLEHKI
jgi:hypothetical protein